MKRWLVALGIMLTSAPAQAAETIIPLDGTVPNGPEDHFFVPFDVPAGTLEIEVRHSAVSSQDVLDWGLRGPDGFRGWGGGNGEPAIVAAAAASRSYLPGPIEPGEWEVIVGKAKLVSDPAAYQLEVVLRDEVTIAPQPEREMYAPSILDLQPRWFAGDLHVHSRESGDARPALDEVATFARMRGLDFVEITDHNVHTSLDFINDAQSRHPNLLLMPGVEFTTYDGHANGIGATQWVDHKIGQPGVTIDGAAQAFVDGGAVFSLDHPKLDLGDLCIGCLWTQDVDLSLVGAVEIATGGLEPFGDTFSNETIAYWDQLCAEGFHIAAVGGSDDHKAGVDLNPFQSPVGDATTMIQADNLSAEALVQGIRDGRTVVKLQGPDDPMIDLDAEGREGDTVVAENPIFMITVSEAEPGDELRVIVDGRRVDTEMIEGASLVHEYMVETNPGDEGRVRAEVWRGGKRRVVTSHVWFVGEDWEGGETGGCVPGDCTCLGIPDPPPGASNRCSPPPTCGCTSGSTRPDLAWLMVLVLLRPRRRHD